MFEIRAFYNKSFYISDREKGVCTCLHSNGDTMHTREYWPTWEQAQVVLNKYQPTMKLIPMYPNYSITKDGRVWSKKRQRTKGGWLKPDIDVNGYLCVELGRGHKWRVHRLVLETYVGSRSDGMVCRHLNGDQIDNRLENLKWGTISENAKDAVEHGTCNLVGKYGENHSQSKLSNEDRRLIIYEYLTGLFTYSELAR